MVTLPYNHKLYLENCRKMIDLNQKQVDLCLEKFHKETDKEKREDLGLEIQGWTKWVKIWEDRLDTAIRNH